MTEQMELSMAAAASAAHNLAFTVIFPLLLYSYVSSLTGLSICVTTVLLSLSLLLSFKCKKNEDILRKKHRASSRA